MGRQHRSIRVTRFPDGLLAWVGMPDTRTLTLMLVACTLVLWHMHLLRSQWGEWSGRCQTYRDAAKSKLAEVQSTVQAAHANNLKLRARIAELEPKVVVAEREDTSAEKELTGLTGRYSKLKREKVEALDSLQMTENERAVIVSQVEQLDTVIADLLISQHNAAKLTLADGTSIQSDLAASEKRQAGKLGHMPRPPQNHSEVVPAGRHGGPAGSHGSSSGRGSKSGSAKMARIRLPGSSRSTASSTRLKPSD